MGPNLALEDEDLPRWKTLLQMIVGSAVAKAKLEHGPRQCLNGVCSHVETSPLGFQTPNEAI